MANTCDNIYYDEPSLTSSCTENLYQNDGNEANEEDLYFTEIDGDFSNSKLRITSQSNGKNKIYFSKSSAINKQGTYESRVYNDPSLTEEFQPCDTIKYKDITRKSKLCRHWKTKIIIILSILVITLVALVVGISSTGKLLIFYEILF